MQSGSKLDPALANAGTAVRESHLAGQADELPWASIIQSKPGEKL